jgi:hypothetical protein
MNGTLFISQTGLHRRKDTENDTRFTFPDQHYMLEFPSL